VSVELEWPDGVEELTFSEFERRVQDGSVPADTPIRFEVVTGRRFVPVGELELYEALAGTGIGDFRERLRKLGAPLFTAILLGLQLRLYLFSLSGENRSYLIENFANWSPAVFEQAQIYRLLSYGFVHVDFSHFLINALFIAYLGWNLERGFGHRNFITVWIAAVFLGGAMSILMTPMRPSIGASAGAFGLLAASVVFGWKHGGQIPKRAAKFFGWGVLPYLVFSLAMGFNSSSVDNWGHIGGLLAGGLLATVLEPEAYKKSAEQNQKLRTVIFTSIVLISYLFVFKGAIFVRLEQHEERGFTTMHPATWERNWTPSGDRGWVSPSFRASIVSKTAQYEHALSLEGAVDAFAGQIEVWGDEVSKIGSREVSWGPFRGVEVQYVFTIRGVEQGLRAVVVPRGRYLHMIYIQTDLSQYARYEELSRRLLDSARITPPPGLLRARTIALSPDSDPVDHLALGVEASRAGYFLEASQAFNSALDEASDEVAEEAAVGLIALYIDYGEGITLLQVQELAERFEMVSSVQLAAADVFIKNGEDESASRLIISAWERGVRDYSIREALLEMGVQIEIPEDVEQ
jgi:rhomboid protease GluP